MKTKKRFSFTFFAMCVWLLFITLTIRKGQEIGRQKASLVTQETFMEQASVERKEDWVGANIWLKQAIHGTKDIKYRYVIKTDCPSWDYETRYITTEPIPWIDETSAVEVMIYDTTVRFGGTVYANGQYFLIPILDDLASESVSIDEWEMQLMQQAYQSYLDYMDLGNKRISVFLLTLLVFGGPVFAVIAIYFPKLHKDKKETVSQDIDH